MAALQIQTYLELNGLSHEFYIPLLGCEQMMEEAIERQIDDDARQRVEERISHSRNVIVDCIEIEYDPLDDVS